VSRSFSIYGMPVLFPSMLDRVPRSKVLSLSSSCSGYQICDLALHFLLLCVGRFPSASCHETDTIIIDDMVLNEDECILND
jgi:hypothetical protein